MGQAAIISLRKATAGGERSYQKEIRINFIIYSVLEVKNGVFF